jgi:hypothetical protein
VRWVPLVTLLAGIAAFADPLPSPRASWASWVGDWQGKLRWSNCTLDGEPAASIAIDAADGAVAIDLAAAGGALGSVPLEPTANGWNGRSADVAVHLARGSGTLELAVELESGCAMHGSLRRASVGIGACDDLEAWARIENRCTRLVKPPLENLARVAHQRAEWSKASAEARSRLATQCKARASKVEAELAVAGCVPDSDPPAPARFPECTALRLAAAKVARCQTLPFEIATSLAHDANALADATAGIDSDSSRDILEKQCRAMREQLVQTASGCSM